MYETFKRFADDSLFAARASIPIMQSHPMPRERVAALEELVAHQSLLGQEGRSGRLQLRHDMMRAKLSGSWSGRTRSPGAIRSTDTQPAGALCARHRGLSHGDLRSALAQIDALIQAQPNNPYFHELQGPGAAGRRQPAEAIAPLRQAVQLSHQCAADPNHARAGAGRDRQ